MHQTPLVPPTPLTLLTLLTHLNAPMNSASPPIPLTLSPQGTHGISVTPPTLSILLTPTTHLNFSFDQPKALIKSQSLHQLLTLLTLVTHLDAPMNIVISNNSTTPRHSSYSTHSINSTYFANTNNSSKCPNQHCHLHQRHAPNQLDTHEIPLTSPIH